MTLKVDSTLLCLCFYSANFLMIDLSENYGALVSVDCSILWLLAVVFFVVPTENVSPHFTIFKSGFHCLVAIRPLILQGNQWMESESSCISKSPSTAGTASPTNYRTTGSYVVNEESTQDGVNNILFLHNLLPSTNPRRERVFTRTYVSGVIIW